MNPMLLGIAVEGNHPFPVSLELLRGLRIILLVTENKSILQSLAFLLALRIRNPTKGFSRLAPDSLRQGVQDVLDLMIPAPLLLPLRVDLSQGRPYPQMPIRNRQPSQS